MPERRTATRLALLLGLLALLAPHPLPADDAAASEAERKTIEALIESVARLDDATFLRNGKSYSASSAARFLRRKWEAHASEVRTADDFIERVASLSSTTSQPYLIRFADGREVPSAEFLRAELARLRAQGP